MTSRFRVLVLTRYPRRGASSRVRVLQYIPYLERAGAEVTVSAFFDNHYLSAVYRSGARPVGSVFAAYARRAYALLGLHQYSVVWVQKELFPYLPGHFERLLARSGVPYVVDLDDALFHSYDQHSSQLVRWFLGRKLDPLLLHAACVFAGNDYLASYVSAHGAHNVSVVPTVVDVGRYPISVEPDDTEFRIGWIGSRTTAGYLDQVTSVLATLSKERPVRLVTIGAPRIQVSGLQVEQHEWAEDSEASLLSRIHAGIMPLPDESWERGKCGYKLIQYMASGRPVVASPVGVNRVIVRPEVGYLASCASEWVTALRTLAVEPDRRRVLGRAARELVESSYSLQTTAPVVVRKLMGAAKLRLAQ